LFFFNDASATERVFPLTIPLLCAFHSPPDRSMSDINDLPRIEA